MTHSDLPIAVVRQTCKLAPMFRTTIGGWLPSVWAAAFDSSPDDMARNRYRFWLCGHFGVPLFLSVLVWLAGQSQSYGGTIWGLYVYGLHPLSLACLQAALLRPQLKLTWLWPFLSVAGLIIPINLFANWGTLHPIGFGMALAQYPLLRTSGFRQPFVWVLLSGYGWLASWQWTAAAGLLFPSGLCDPASHSPSPWIFITLSSLFYGLLTGLYALWFCPRVVPGSGIADWRWAVVTVALMLTAVGKLTVVLGKQLILRVSYRDSAMIPWLQSGGEGLLHHSDMLVLLPPALASEAVFQIIRPISRWGQRRGWFIGKPMDNRGKSG